MSDDRKVRGPSFSTSLLFILIFLSGVDGFLLLENLREFGSRPFYIPFLLIFIWYFVKNRAYLSPFGLMCLCGLFFASFVGFIFLGQQLKPTGDRSPVTQFISQGSLFLIGFSPFAMRFRVAATSSQIINVARWSLFAHSIFIAIDGVALILDVTRPFEGIFISPLLRPFPTGMFSEPSYVAAYVGIFLPVALSRSRPFTIAVWSLVFSLIFFVGDVRSFFVVYFVGIFILLASRWGLSLRLFGIAAIALVVLAFVGSELNLFSVTENLSSAYRLGNSYAYLTYALQNNWLVGSGLGTSHFLYSSLDHPSFIYLSDEFQGALVGNGYRVPVFNMWVRLFVELGVLPTLFMLGYVLYVFRARSTSPIARIVFGSSFAFAMSTDSYIYGCCSVALLLLFSIRVYKSENNSL